MLGCSGPRWEPLQPPPLAPAAGAHAFASLGSPLCPGCPSQPFLSAPPPPPKRQAAASTRPQPQSNRRRLPPSRQCHHLVTAGFRHCSEKPQPSSSPAPQYAPGRCSSSSLGKSEDRLSLRWSTSSFSTCRVAVGQCAEVWASSCLGGQSSPSVPLSSLAWACCSGQRMPPMALLAHPGVTLAHRAQEWLEQEGRLEVG